MDDRPKKTPSLLKRDGNNQLIDADEGRKIAAELTAKLMNESQRFEKDNSMHFARTGKRDVVVHIAVTILPQVDGVNIVGEREKEVGQWCFRLNSRILPVRRQHIFKYLSELATIGKNALIRIGAVIE